MYFAEPKKVALASRAEAPLLQPGLCDTEPIEPAVCRPEDGKGEDARGDDVEEAFPDTFACGGSC